MNALHLRNTIPFQPENVQLPGFDWNRAAENLWRGRIYAIFHDRPRRLWFRDDEISQRALQLTTFDHGATILDPTVLREKYESVIRVAEFTTPVISHLAKIKPLNTHQIYGIKSANHALLALCALLLFINDWSIRRASAVFANLTALPSAMDSMEGNVMGLNPFHDYRVWSLIYEAQRIGQLRADTLPVVEQVASVQTELRVIHQAWMNRAVYPAP